MTKSKSTRNPSITAIIIAKNESEMIVNCINTLSWCDDVLVIDSASDDNTASLAESAGVRVVGFSHRSMAKARNEALKKVKTDWVVYVDADERVTPILAKEIMVQIETSAAVALSMPRQNIHYGKIMQHGGWDKDPVTRVFNRNKFEEWYGDIHESPRFTGEEIRLKSPLIHLTHRNTLDGLKKTISWTAIEADLLAKANPKPVKITTVLRKGIMEFIRRGILKQGYRDGTEGWIESIVQGINKMLVYVQLWERQRKPSLENSYKKIEQQISKMWQDE
ncbi:MAG: glycosyltransferase family 2 protein [Candidatus Pacebacteria bacterium]|jgi:glycosyltransferase involved in cell wall biosynthesis|nr:glycosyltransferase family 2 protein [Candidatus Paceibacterota bacterium]MBT3512199.1 glycosyltransferase family 2 protein [Candidatus Paceibacterota bacterium]MBT4004571.1 glycosyltransferase family 2 protein [Candidatus Paceibacterota bacterium]MBT4359181.1 glycosyltransferase family 2 protein [Candidatus Paceibacterota bacterium]MBT4681067.1 glycosyltransferase family 2 protein [Candidatus Paceibacterota bacterium]